MGDTIGEANILPTLFSNILSDNVEARRVWTVGFSIEAGRKVEVYETSQGSSVIFIKDVRGVMKDLSIDKNKILDRI